jgi:hypothetical protein
VTSRPDLRESGGSGFPDDLPELLHPGDDVMRRPDTWRELLVEQEPGPAKAPGGCGFCRGFGPMNDLGMG